jgi:hypothetical protein
VGRAPESAGEFAAPEGRAVPPDAVAPGVPVTGAVVPGVVVPGVSVTGAVVPGVPVTGTLVVAVLVPAPPAVAVARVVAGAVAGLNVATDSMAPATRQTARMLASSGITVPGPRNGLVSLRSR